MSRDLVIIKLGGSVITDKSKNKGVFRKGVVKRLCREIAEAQKKKPFDLILVHGAGSFGHPIAKKYNLTEGYSGFESTKGVALCKKVVLNLNLLMLKELLEAGIYASAVQPSAIITTSSKKIASFDMKAIGNLFKINLVPVLYGDVVMDARQGFAIVSGDSIVSYLAKRFRAKKVIFVSDVDGIYDKNPKMYPNAHKIDQIDIKNYQNVLKNIQIHNKNDISGEMKGKILAVKDNLSGVEVKIISGFVDSALQKTLLGAELGTKILF